MRSNQGTIIHQRPIVSVGDKVKAGDVLADGSSTAGGEIALGKNCLVAFMSWEGYNFEDAIIISERLVKDDELTSIHIEEYEVDARTTEARRRGDHARHPEPLRGEPAQNLDERGIVRIGAEVAVRRPAGRQGHAEGARPELTAEEKLIRAIFKEKAREVRDTSLKVPHGEGGVVIDVLTFSREAGDDLPPGVNDLVRVYVATKRKIAEGDKLAGRHGNKGVISKIVPEEDMPFMEDGRPVDVILNPLGVPSRMNIGQILETHLGWVAAQRLVRRRLRLLQARPQRRTAAASTWRRRSSTAPPSRTCDNALVQWQDENADSGIDLGVDKRASDRATAATGKVQLYNGRTGEPYEGKVDDRLHVHPEAAAPGRRQDPRPLDRPLLAGHPAAAGRQGAVRRPALRRDGGVGARRPTAPRTPCRRCSRSSPTTPSAASRPTRRSSRARTSPSPRFRSRSRSCSRRSRASRWTPTWSPRRATEWRWATRRTTSSAPPRSSASSCPECARTAEWRRRQGQGQGRRRAGKSRSSPRATAVLEAPDAEEAAKK